ncbi:MAG: helix-turn-helix domain-containing protein, partial [Ktedonobacterales bacterium]
MNQRDDESQHLSWQVHWGRLLRAARQVAGLSLAELAVATGLTKGYLSKLESGHATALNPSRATLAALALALPSFRPIAHSLGPIADEGPVAIQPDPRAIPHLLPLPDDNADSPQSVSLGWPELEVVVAIVTLERAAVVQPLTASLLARAVGRERAAINLVLKRLVEMRILHRRPPMRPGGLVSYQCAPDFEARVGIC